MWFIKFFCFSSFVAITTAQDEIKEFTGCNDEMSYVSRKAHDVIIRIRSEEDKANITASLQLTRAAYYHAKDLSTETVDCGTFFKWSGNAPSFATWTGCCADGLPADKPIEYNQCVRDKPAQLQPESEPKVNGGSVWEMLLMSQMEINSGERVEDLIQTTLDFTPEALAPLMGSHGYRDPVRFGVYVDVYYMSIFVTLDEENHGVCDVPSGASERYLKSTFTIALLLISLIFNVV